MKGKGEGESVRQWETERDRSASRLGEDMQNCGEILLWERLVRYFP